MNRYRTRSAVLLLALLLTSVCLSAHAVQDPEFRQFLDAAYRKHTGFEASLDQLQTYDRSSLSTEDQLSYDLFAWYLEDQILIRALALGEIDREDVPYETLLHHHTTTRFSPSELFEILRGAVEENQAAVNRCLSEIQLPGDSFHAQMEAVNKTGVQKTTQAGISVAAEMQGYVDRAEEALRPCFAIYPVDPVVVTPVPGLLSAAGFRFGSEAQGRPNQVQILPGRNGVPYYLRLTIAHHEAYPGHYVQEHNQNQLTHLPEFRQRWGFGAYTESWALYGEQLAYDMGLFEDADPLHRLGFVESKLWRSTHALADVGLNGMGWTVEEAVTRLTETLVLTATEARTRVTRMLEDPGAATASYTGYLCLMRFRTRAQEALGDDFEWAAFHRVILETGPAPMEILETVVDCYIEEIAEATPPTD